MSASSGRICNGPPRRSPVVAMTGRTTNVAGQDIIPAQVERTQLTLRRTKTQDKRMSIGHQGSLRRSRDFAPAAVALRATQNSGLPCSSNRRVPDPSRQSADGCALCLGSRRGICVYHRRCGTIHFRQTRAPFGPHSDEDLRWRPGAPQACHFASVITNKLSEVDPQAA